MSTSIEIHSQERDYNCASLPGQMHNDFGEPFSSYPRPDTGFSSDLKISRRNLVKRVVGTGLGLTVGVPLLRRSALAEALDDDQKPKDVLSKETIDLINKPFEQQAAEARGKFDYLKSSASHDSLMRVGPSVAILDPSIFPTTIPPRMTPDLELARANKEDFYYMEHRDQLEEFPSRGLVLEQGPTPDMPDYSKYAFSSAMTALLADITNHKILLVDGRVAQVQLLHAFLVNGKEKKGRASIPLFLNSWTAGYPGEDPEILAPQRGWFDADPDPKKNTLPIMGEAPELISYATALNRMVSVRGIASAVISIGQPQIIAQFNYEQEAPVNGFPVDFYTDDYMYGNDATNGEYYIWMNWLAAFAGANSQHGEWNLVSYRDGEKRRHEILDIFPNAVSRKGEPDVITSEYYVGKVNKDTGLFDIEPKEWITMEDLKRTPKAYINRLEVSKKHSIYDDYTPAAA